MAGPSIISLLPSATEMICALGLADQLVGVTHECDYPPLVRAKPKVVRNALPIETMTEREIDVAVTERLRAGLSLYLLDEELIAKLRPDIIITQSLCEVCAPSHNEIAKLLQHLEVKPRILFQTPHSMCEVLGCLEALAEETGRQQQARVLIEDAHRRLDGIRQAVAAIDERPRVFCMEWLDPVYCSGHWVPEMVRIAGGVDTLGKEGTDSLRLDWREVLEWAPEVLIFMPCGYDLSRAAERAAALSAMPGFADLPAARNGCAYAVDASSYFARPGPRIIEGAELMAHLLHPDRICWTGRTDAYRRVQFGSSSVLHAATSEAIATA